MRKIICLNEGWSFAQSPTRFAPPFDWAEEQFVPVTLPHSWNAQDGQSGGYLRSCCAYRRVVHLPADAGQAFFLEFRGANSVCRAYLNGTLLGEHRGGYSTFRFEITGLCHPGGQDELVVFVDNRETSDVSPLGGDFTIYGGLYRGVDLICVPHSHFDLLFHGTCGVLATPRVAADGTATLSIESHLCAGAEDRVTYTVTAPDGTVAVQAEREADDAGCVLEIPTPVLWHGVQAPALYTLQAVLAGADGSCDEVSLAFGLRSIRLDPAQGFFLNGQRLALHGVARHQDRQGKGNAITLADQEQDLALIRQIGANAVRLSHYQHAQEFYDLCDQAGLVVWAEIPMLVMTEDEALMQNACEQLTELILQNRHHPSICFWGLQNEIAIAGETLAMYRNVERLQALAHALDDTRPTAAANLYCVKNNSPLNFITDAVAYNIYFGWYYGEMGDYAAFLDKFHADNPDTALAISEYGVDANPAFHSDAPHVKDYSEEFQCLFHETAYGILSARPYLWATFVWNMFDFGSALRNEGGTVGRNCKGLVSYDRTLCKDAFYYYKACWSQEPFVHINGRRFRDRAADQIKVTVYSNQAEVQLTVNGERLPAQRGKTRFEFDVPLRPGENIVTACAAGQQDRVVWNRVEQPNPAYTYHDPNPGYNVKNWFTLGQTEQDLFPADRYSLMDTIADLLAEPRAVETIQAMMPGLVDDPRIAKAGAFTLFKLLNRTSGQHPEALVQELNRALNGIKKNR